MEMKCKAPTMVLILLLTVSLIGFVGGCGNQTTTTVGSGTGGNGTSTTEVADGQPVVSEWVIPLIGVQTGPAAGWGLDGIRAAQFAVDKINAEGGVLGKPIKLEIYDTSGEVDKSITAMDRVLKTPPLSLTFLPNYD